jgi:hypothetical protein
MDHRTAQHFSQSEAYLYVADRAEKKGEIMTASGKRLPTTIPFRSSLADRWPASDRAAWEPGRSVDIGGLMKDVIHEGHRYFELQRPEEMSVIAAWTIGTYVYEMFDAYPRLNFHGEKGSGKSKLLQFIGAIAFNGVVYISTTPAALFRLIEEYQSTLCLDEMEHLGGPDHKAIKDILNSGYKPDIRVPRTETDERGRYIVKEYEVYAPIAFAGIRGLDSTLASRCITFRVVKGTDRAKINTSVSLRAPQFGGFRSLGYRMAFGNFREIRERHAEIDPHLPTWLNARLLELYKPILAIASFYPPAYDEVLSVAKREAQTESGLSEDGEELIQRLETWMENKMIKGKQVADKDAMEIEVYPKDLAEALSPEYGPKMTSNQAAQLLNRYGFPFSRHTRKGNTYRVTAAHLTRLREIYCPALTGGEADEASPR